MKSKNLIVLPTLLFAAGSYLTTGCQNNRVDRRFEAARSNVDEDPVTQVAGHTVLAAEAIFAGDPSIVESYFADVNVAATVGAIDQDEDLYQVKFPSANLPLTKVIDDLEERLEFIEPNFIVRGAGIRDWPKDPEFLKLWGLNNIGQSAPNGLEGKAEADLQLLEAWQTTKGSRDVVVGVIDTGIDYKHPDLKDNIWVNEAERDGVAGVDDDGNGYVDDFHGWDFVSAGRTAMPQDFPGDNDPMDDQGHGTHCAGTIGAVGNNHIGVTGVNWQVSLMALKFLSKEGSGSSLDAYRAIRYGVENGADVLSNSWGGGGRSKLVERAVRMAEEKGVLFIAAAGNSTANNDLVDNFPSNYDGDHVISVGATDNMDAMAYFTSYGQDTVDVFAPGVNILSTVPTALANGAPYETFSGTSMATPHVAGVAALLLAHDESLRGNATEVRSRLIATSDMKPGLVGKSLSNGRLNARRALANERSEIAQGEFEEEDYNYRSPAFPRSQVDVRHKIERPGAKALKVHFDWLQVEEPFDSIYLYDGNLRLITRVEANETSDWWSPLIPGDTAYVRFVNSKVQIVKQKEQVFDSVDAGLKAGATTCIGNPDGTYTCFIDDEAVQFVNFNSEGFQIDRLAVLL